MKTTPTFALVTAAFTVGLLAAHLCFAQPAHKSASAEATTDSYIALHELESFVAYLHDSNQTNTLQRFNQFMSVNIVSEQSGQLGVRVGILYNLRKGRTNEAIRLLESQMTSDAVGIAAGYKELPPAIQKKVSLTAFNEARDYYRKYSPKSSNSDVNAIVEKAFNSLDEHAVH